MTNRREFLHIGMAALSLPIAARAGASSGIFSGEDEQRTEPLYKIVFDERFVACRRFGDEIKRRALPVKAIRGDITEIWYSDLYYRWKEARGAENAGAIAGMTAPGAIFCLETLARDAGMRVALRVDHRRMSAADEHEFAGPENVWKQAAGLKTIAGNWPERMAEIVARFPADPSGAVNARILGHVANGAGGPERLVTWVIAAMRQAIA